MATGGVLIKWEHDFSTPSDNNPLYAAIRRTT